jgi:vitamin B12 transporter
VWSALPAAWAQAEGAAAVQVVGTRAPSALGSVVADVVVLDREQLRATTADSVEDLIRRVGGIQLSRNGGPGQNASVFVRGSGASSTLVLVDGVRVGSATLGQTDLAALSLGLIERIEIMRGPGSSLYGADAVGGVINIVTRRGAGAPWLQANLLIGTERSAEGYAAVSGAQGEFDYAFSLSGETGAGASAVVPGDALGIYNPDDDGYDRGGVNLAGGWTFAPGQRAGLSYFATRLNAQFDSAEYLPPTFAPDPSPDFRNELTTQLAALDWRGVFSPQWTATLRGSWQSDALDSGANVISRYDTTRRQFTAQATWAPTPEQQLVGALDWLGESIASTDYAAPDRDNTGLVLGYTGRFTPFRLQADLRWDHNSAYGDNTTGKLGAAVELPAGFSLRALIGNAFRAPTFNDLYYPGYGVPTIQPETSRSIEAGAGYQADATTVNATWYRNDVSDLIGFQGDPALCPPGYPFGCADNTSEARLQGVTVQALQRLGAFGFTLALDWLKATDQATGQRLPRRASNQQSFAVDWNEGPWQLGGTLVAVGSRPEAGTTLPAYWLLDLNARWRFERDWQLEARLNNATDEAYQPVKDYQGVGRRFWIGLRYDGRGL